MSLRRSDQVDNVRAETLMLERDCGGPRLTCVRAEFSKTGASTPGGHFIVTLCHTQSGSIKSGVFFSPLQFKEDRRGAEI